MKTLRDYLEGVSAALLCGLLVMLLVASCAPFQPKAKPAATEKTVEVTGTLAGRRINAEALIDELDQSGCELQTLTYEEGKRRAIFTAKCRVIGE